jgi:DNA polymerase III delta prime subunit
MAYGNTDWDELRRRANRNLAQLAADKRAGKAKPEVKKAKRQPPTADELETGQMIEELESLQKLERKIARRSATKKGFEGSDYNQGMWEEVDHRIEQLQEELDAYTADERRKLKSAWKRYQKRGVRNIA